MNIVILKTSIRNVCKKYLATVPTMKRSDEQLTTKEQVEKELNELFNSFYKSLCQYEKDHFEITELPKVHIEIDEKCPSIWSIKHSNDSALKIIQAMENYRYENRTKICSL